MKKLTKTEKKRILKEFKNPKDIVLILENVQYATNVASIFRIADCADVKRVFLSGISTQPPFGKDLKKTSRGKEDSVEWRYFPETSSAINELKNQGYQIIAIEFTDESIEFKELYPTLTKKVCYVFGSEVYGLKRSTLDLCDFKAFLPVFRKYSLLNITSEVTLATLHY